MFKRFILIAAIAICITAREVAESEEIVEEPPFVLVLPKQRERRAVVTGGGSNKGGSITIEHEQNILANDKTSLDVSGSVRHSWAKKTKSRTDFGLGGKVTHKVYNKKGLKVNSYLSGHKQWLGLGGMSKYIEGGFVIPF